MPPAERRFPRTARCAMVLAAGLVAAIFWLPAGQASAAPPQARLPAAGQAVATQPKVVVTFVWGGGLADQMASLPIFRKYGMHATYFIPSGLVCTLGQAKCAASSQYLTLGDVREIAAAGNEIGGLSVMHQQLTTIPAAEAKREICDDRSNLISWGFRPTDFAYPFGVLSPAVEALTRECGYNSGLSAGTLRGAGSCDECAWAESIPPQDPYNVQTPIEVNSTSEVWVPRTYESIVTGAQRHGGGWIVFTIHDVCRTDCSLGTSPEILGAVLKWLRNQRADNVVVEPMNKVIGGPLRPAVAGPAPRRLPYPGVANASLTKAAGGTPVCFQQVSNSGTAATFSYQARGGPHGAAAETVRVTRAGNGSAKLLQTMDLGLCAPSVSSGSAYKTGMWYTATGTAQIEVYRRTSVGSWLYWVTSPALPASASWRQASWTTPAVPAGTTALSFGMTTKAVGAITTSDYSLQPAKSYKTLMLLGVLAVVLAGGGLIARGHYRYRRYVAAEAAALAAETAKAEAEAAIQRAARSEAARAEASRREAARAEAARAEAARAEAMKARVEAARARVEAARAAAARPKADPGRVDDATVVMKAIPEEARETRDAAGDATVAFKPVNLADSQQASGD
jgi:peptidoglycan/xylan/chitin deacetylase (PgdA/CDA1 family)